MYIHILYTYTYLCTHNILFYDLGVSIPQPCPRYNFSGASEAIPKIRLHQLSKVIEEVGRGVYGAVSRAEHVQTGHVVAIKRFGGGSAEVEKSDGPPLLRTPSVKWVVYTHLKVIFKGIFEGIFSSTE